MKTKNKGVTNFDRKFINQIQELSRLKVSFLES